MHISDKHAKMPQLVMNSTKSQENQVVKKETTELKPLVWASVPTEGQSARHHK